MSDNPWVDKVMDKVVRNGESEWRARDPPRFIRSPKAEEELTHNFRQYVTGYPWMVLAKDQAGYTRYHCGICRKVATICHMLIRSPHRQDLDALPQFLGTHHSQMDGAVPGFQHTS